MTTGAITASQTPSAITPATEPQIDETIIAQKRVITLIFICTMTMLASFFGSIPFGLMAGLSCFVVAWGVITSPEESPVIQPPANLIEELHLDPAHEIRPHYIAFHVSPDEHARLMRRSFDLQIFDRALSGAIFRQSLHYGPSGSFCTFMRDHFHEVDVSRLALLGVKPIRFANGEEGYEIAIQSREPEGWIHLCINKHPGIIPQRGGDCNFTRIPQVTPFLERNALELNHFSTFILPFDLSHLFNAFANDFRDMDLCQIELTSCRPVSFYYRHSAAEIPPLITPLNLGFELVFSTAVGVIRYYVAQNGVCCNHPENIQYLFS